MNRCARCNFPMPPTRFNLLCDVCAEIKEPAKPNGLPNFAAANEFLPVTGGMPSDGVSHGRMRQEHRGQI